MSKRGVELTDREVVVDVSTVRRAYKVWAPIYDQTFGFIARAGRMHAVKQINALDGGRVLEVGVGTGLSLPHYRSDLEVTGIDLSPEMLEKAEERVQNRNLSHVDDLLLMDAANLEFPDNHFNVVAAMFVITVVPDPVKVMNELQRVCAPGGEVLLINHFSQEHGVRGWIERQLEWFGSTGFWKPQFPVDRVMVCDRLELKERRDMHPFGLFTILRFHKLEDGEPSRPIRRRVEHAPVASYDPSPAQAGL
jgi:phosphatidylethanolamine/phosphatidyl-N-methylethanolamine N-methyltransferase